MFYNDPRKLALWRIAQWDQAIRNIQGANSASNAGLAGIATTLGYRAARNLSKTATVGWAAAGLFGLSVSEAFVQVSRINVYSAGINGVECALSAYGPSEVTFPSTSIPFARPPDQTSIAQLERYAAKIPEGDEQLQKIASLRAEARGVLDEGLLLAVSSISRDVDSALMGTIVTATSRGGSWSGVFNGALEKAKAKGPVVAALGAPTAEQLEARAVLRKALAEAQALADSVTARRARMDRCGINGATAGVELIGKPLSIDLLGKDSLTVKQGQSVEFRVYGGTGTYAATLSTTSAAQPPEVTLNSAGIRIVTITTEPTTTLGDYEVIVAEPGAGNAQLVAFRVVAK